MSVPLSVLLVVLAHAHRDMEKEQDLKASYNLQIDQDAVQFQELHLNHMDNATAAASCPSWCKRKVETPEQNPDGTTKESEKCNGLQCTWDVVCGYQSGVCKECPECQSRCEKWCEPKVGKQECGKKGMEHTCSSLEVCKFGNSVKCSDCAFCKAGNPKDPTCATGVRSTLAGNDPKRLCCKHTCGPHCGGPDCAKDGRDSADCCGKKIFSAKKECKNNLPPCLLEIEAGPKKTTPKNISNHVKARLGLMLAILTATIAVA